MNKNKAPGQTGSNHDKGQSEVNNDLLAADSTSTDTLIGMAAIGMALVATVAFWSWGKKDKNKSKRV